MYKLLYKLTHSFSNKLSYLVRYLIYRKAVKEPANLELLLISEENYNKAIRSSFNYNTQNTKIKLEKNIKIGFIDSFASNVALSPDLMIAKPKNIDLYIYEYVINNRSSKKIVENISNYKEFRVDIFESKYDRVFRDKVDYQAIAKAVNSDNLDAVFIGMHVAVGLTTNKLIDLLKTPNIIPISYGNTFMVNDKCRVQSKLQVPLCYDIIDKKLVSKNNQNIFNNYYFFDDFFYYDMKDIEMSSVKFKDRKKNIFIHGRLSKIATNNYLNSISKILKSTKNSKFIFMGFNDLNSLEFIIKYFKNNNLENQIEYLGAYNATKNEYGIIDDISWSICKDYMQNSLIFTNPFPHFAGTSRLEAMKSKMAVIDINYEYFNCQKSDFMTYYNLPKLLKKNGSAKNIDEYIELVIRLLNGDEELYENIVKEQDKILDIFTNKDYFWKKAIEIVEFSNQIY